MSGDDDRGAALVLTNDETRTLLLRYEFWGIDKVRAQVDSRDRRLFASPEVIDLARAWVREKEKESEHHTKCQIKQALFVIGVAMVIVIGISFLK